MLDKIMNSTFSFLMNERELTKQRKYINSIYEMNKKHYENQLSNATSLFNKTYYRNYLDTPNARNMLKKMREQMNDKSKALRNTASVMGTTPEALAIVQKDNNRALDSLMGNLAQADATQREKALYMYEDQRNRIEELLHKAKMENMAQNYMLDEKHFANKMENFMPYIKNGIDQMQSSVASLAAGQPNDTGSDALYQFPILPSTKKSRDDSFMQPNSNKRYDAIIDLLKNNKKGMREYGF